MKKVLLVCFMIFISAFAFSACKEKNPTSETAEYAVNFYDGTELCGTVSVKEGEAPKYADKEKEGYKFAGWYLKDGKSLAEITSVTSNLDFYAKWQKLYNLKFSLAGGEGDVSSYATKETAGAVITLPSGDGLSFGTKGLSGWNDGENTYLPDSEYTMPAASLTLTAVWADFYNVSYATGCETEIASVKVAGGNKITLPENLAKEGYTLNSWNDGAKSYKINSEYIVNGDVTLTAEWAGNYTVYFDANDGNFDTVSVNGVTNDEITLGEPTREHYTFLGWLYNGIHYFKGDKFTVGFSDATLVADWQEITFNVNLVDWDGGLITTVAVGEGQDVVIPELDICSIPEFKGWSGNGKNVTQDVTLKALYNYTLPETSELYTFTKHDNYYNISSGNTSYLKTNEIILPSTYKGLLVKGVENVTGGAFYAFSGVTKITLTSTYEVLDKRAFYGMDALNEVVLDCNLKTIGDDCFMNCNALTTLSFNEGLESIGTRAFYNVNISNFNLPSTLKSIAEIAFFYYSTTSYTSVTSYQSVSVNENNIYFSSENGVLYNKDKSAVIYYPSNKNATSYTVPENVTSLGAYSFAGAWRLTEFSFGINSKVAKIGSYAFSRTNFNIVLPDSVTEISENMINFASGKVTLNNTITVIPKNAFSSYLGASITIPATVTTIEEYAFQGSSVKNVEFAEGSLITAIPDYAFENCHQLENVKFTEGLKTIGAYAFSVSEVTYAMVLKTLNFPASLESIGLYAFSYCTELTEINFAEGSMIKEIGNGAFGCCTALTTVNFGDNCCDNALIIYAQAFYRCSSLKSLVLPDNLTVIGAGCFAGVDSSTLDVPMGLTSINIPVNVTEIGDGAFFYNTNLAKVTFAENSKLITIGESAFKLCTSLNSIALPSSLTTLGSEAFSQCYNLSDIVISGDNLSYEFSNGGLYNTVTKTLEFVHVGEDGIFTVKDGTKIIKDHCFYKTQIVTVNIADSVEEIGEYSFYLCITLKNVNISDNSNLKTIGDYSFASFATNPYSANADFIQIETINLPEGLKTIGGSAFYMTNLKNVTIPSTVSEMTGYCFAYCLQLETVTFAADSAITEIGAASFCGDTALKSVVFGSGSRLLKIRSIVFSGCTAMNALVLTSSAVTLGNGSLPVAKKADGSDDYANTKIKIYVPDDSVAKYINSSSWYSYKSHIYGISTYQI